MAPANSAAPSGSAATAVAAMLAVIPAPVSANASGSMPGISAICSIIVLAKSAAPSGSAWVAADATFAVIAAAASAKAPSLALPSIPVVIDSTIALATSAATSGTALAT